MLSVVEVEGSLRWSLDKATSNHRQAVLLTPSLQQPVSSAVHKLQEALAVVGHQLSSVDIAIDLGDT